jgi:uncharacterized protein
VARESLSPAEARRGLLAAQGLATPAPGRSPVTSRQVLATVRGLGGVQIDSVNVLSRAQYLPVFSRLGDYSRDSLDRAASRAPRSLFEYWGHEATLLPVRLHPFMRWRMAEMHAWGGVAATAAENPAHVAAVLAAVADLGPVTGPDLERALVTQPRGPKTDWGWNWSLTKRVLEHLFWGGELSSAGRDRSFRRRYDLAERVIPRSVLAEPTPSRPDAIRHLVATAARALGVATATDLQDYYRLPATETRAAIRELVESGELAPVAVPGWPPAWRHRELRIPRDVAGDALLVPFDPLIWDRRRVLRVFGMHYRIEIYVPAAKRVHGYYVLPFLMGDRLVARVDLKADRPAGVLRVGAAILEPDCRADQVAPALAARLRELGRWLEAPDVAVAGGSDLSHVLRRWL